MGNDQVGFVLGEFSLSWGFQEIVELRLSLRQLGFSRCDVGLAGNAVELGELRLLDEQGLLKGGNVEGKGGGVELDESGTGWNSIANGNRNIGDSAGTADGEGDFVLGDDLAASRSGGGEVAGSDGDDVTIAGLVGLGVGGGQPAGDDNSQYDKADNATENEAGAFGELHGSYS